MVLPTKSTFYVLPRLFGVVVAIVAVWIVFTALFNHPKTLTPEEQVAALAVESDHGPSQHIPQLYGASAIVKTKWNQGIAHYDMSLVDAKPDLVGWLAKQPKYSFVVTYYEDDKPAAQILAPFAGFHRDGNVKNLVLNGQGDNKMSQQMYEKLVAAKSWDVNWAPVK